MSLNGLEATEVIEAYQSALGEGGGWFLLKYISRDEVALLERGTGGLVEAQEAINRYEEPSPLFGFIQYRRRKVILKYVPEGTSRLLQARVSVQFQSVTEKLTPYDTIFAFTKSSELQDSALSSACSLHTASPSLKPSNDSLPQRGLAEITEDASESRVEDGQRRKCLEDVERGSLPRQSSEDSQTRSENINGVASANHALNRTPSVTTQRNPQRPRTTSNTDKALPPTPGNLQRENVAARSILDYGDYEPRPGVEGRMSSQSTRPSTRDLYDAYGYKQKVKFGPRPSIESVGRPENMDRHNHFRPVSTLPAGLRMPTRKAVPHKAAPAPTRPQSAKSQSQQAQTAFPEGLSSRETLPAAPVTPIQIPDGKLSIVSNGLLTPAKTPAEPKPPTITPEKRRLMKALQLRQKHIAAHKAANDIGMKDIPPEKNITKPQVDGSILSAMLDTSSPTAQPDAVHVAVEDVSKEEPRNVEASPISTLETSEGPSTQASSLTDEEEIMAPTKQESEEKEASAMPRKDTSPPENATEETFPPSVEARKIRSEEEGHKIGQEVQDLSTGHANEVIEHDGPTKQVLDVRHEPPTGEGNLGEGTYEAPSAIETPAALNNLAVTDGRDALAEDIGQIRETETPALYLIESSNVSLNVSTSPQGRNIPTAEAQCKKEGFENMQSEDLVATPTQHSEVHVIDKETVVLENMPSKVSNMCLEPQGQGSGSSSLQNNQRGVDDPPREQCFTSQMAISVPIDDINPHEVPLPPIGENEEISLSPQRSLQAPPVSQTSTKVETEFSVMTSQAEQQAQGNDLIAMRSSISDTVNEKQGERQMRRRGVFNPPKRISSPENSDEHFLSDDSFMEELKDATVQEAMPISVSKSPIKPVFSRSESEQRLADTTGASRSVSSPLNQSSKDEEVISSPRLPTHSSSRSFSAHRSLHPDVQQAPVSMPKKIGVSSGISQRIKALEQLSSRPTSPQSQAAPPNTTFISVRKTSMRAPGTSDVNNSFNNKSHPASVYPSPSPSPEAVKSNPFNNLNKVGSSRPESVSVTATIVRDARNKTPEIPLNLSEPRAMDLHQSPLVVEHQKMAPPPLSPLKPPRPRYARYSSARSGSSSSTEQKLEAPPHTARRDSFASLRSKSSRAGSEVELPPRSLSDSSLSAITNLDDLKEEKKDSKRSRLMKRMSSISSMSRRSFAHALSPSPKEAPIMERQEPIAEAPSASIDVGDVNIQFPDTLLWKRRHMVIDEQGILVLSPSKSDNNSKVITKRFPLAGFRPPYIPDQDRQELPNSVILDFKDGSTLQCACEHLQGQASVLQTLRQSHSVHQSR